jgi:hypothetical protein
MKPTAIFTLSTLLLTSGTSASLMDTVQDIVGSGKAALNHLTPLTTAVQIPCCSAPPCPGCPAIRANSSISFEQTGLKPLITNPPGCGEGFNSEDCLRFFQVMLTTFERPLGIAVGKLPKSEEEKGKEGCGTESTPGECLRYVTGFLGEVMGPLGITLGEGGVVDRAEVVEENGNKGEGKDEL